MLFISFFHKDCFNDAFSFLYKCLKPIHFVNSVCTIFIFWKRDPSHQTFPSHQSWHQLSFYENKILEQNCFLNEFLAFSEYLNFTVLKHAALTIIKSLEVPDMKYRQTWWSYVLPYHKHRMNVMEKITCKLVFALACLHEADWLTDWRVM